METQQEIDFHTVVRPRTTSKCQQDRTVFAEPVFKEDVQVQKAIGFIACISVMAASLHLFSGGDPSRILSAQTESAPADGYGSVARRFMRDARQYADDGNFEEARRMATTVA